MDEEEIKIKMDDSVDTSLASEGFTYLLTWGRHGLVSDNQNDIVVPSTSKQFAQLRTGLAPRVSFLRKMSYSQLSC